MGVVAVAVSVAVSVVGGFFLNRRQIGRLLADDHDNALYHRPQAFAKFMMALSSGRPGEIP
ncbi:hypothetical protein QR685DRAFT_556707 [Neurospora intermedia]|uniref:Uncharacterized protein n=1 Tax=Neurospora intermedia TaxID=5142 RepID=A0ABR3D270_NEUIN